MPQQQIQLPSNIPPGNPPVHPQLPIQPNLNPNSKGAQQADTLNLPSYNMYTVELYEINLRSGQVVDAQPSPIIIEQVSSEIKEPETIEEKSNQASKNQTSPQLLITQEHQVDLPYPERLALSKQIPQVEFDLFGELQNLYVKIQIGLDRKLRVNRWITRRYIRGQLNLLLWH